MSLVAHALSSLESAREYLQLADTDITRDRLLESMINAATGLIENYCGRRFKKTTYTDELHDGNGTQYIFLRNRPIVSVTSIYSHDPVVTDVLYDSDYYVVYNNQGYIYRAGGWTFGHQNIKITYIAGLDFDAGDRPAELEEICNALVSKTFNNPTKYGIESEKIGQYSIKYAGIANLVEGLPADLINRLKMYANMESDVV